MILAFYLQFFVALLGCAVYIVAAEASGFEDRIDLPKNLLFVFICTMIPFIQMKGWNLGMILIIIVAFSIGYYFFHVVRKVRKEIKKDTFRMGHAGFVIRRGA